MTNGTSTRPGGLMALAVFNFIFAALGLVGVAGVAAAMGNAKFRAAFQEEVGHPITDQWLGIIMALGALEALLLILSGVGYLGQKRVMGRIVGSLYGIVGLANTAHEASYTGIQIMTMIGVVYPLLTLLLLNLTFRDDLIH